MIELTDRDFQSLCADEGVRRIIGDANRSGRRAAFGFWGILIAGLAMIGGATWYLIAIGHDVLGVVVGSVGVLAVYILAALPLAIAGRAIKLPVYEVLAERHGLIYAPLVEQPLFYAGPGAALFGDEPGVESFTDYFQGRLPDGCDFMTCQAYLLPEKGGRFNGRFFAFTRRHAGREQTIAAPDCPAWVEKLCRQGKARLHAGPEAIFVALAGRKGFTPGLGFRFRRGEDRVRAMFDDLAESLALLSRLRAGLDPGP